MGVLHDQKGNHYTWIEAIVLSMKIIGHPTTVETIYDVMVHELKLQIPSSAKTPTQTIRGQIYTNSNDSKAGKDKKVSLFYKESPGVWGLVETKIKRKNQDLHCEICGFSFKEQYGFLGEDYIEKYYLESTKEYVNVCANCHCMLKKIKPSITRREELKRILRNKE